MRWVGDMTVICYQEFENYVKSGCRLETGDQQLPFSEVSAKEIFHVIDYVNAVSNNLCG